MSAKSLCNVRYLPHAYVDGEEFTEKNALKFRFHVKCSEKDIQPPLNSKPSKVTQGSVMQ